MKGEGFIIFYRSAPTATTTRTTSYKDLLLRLLLLIIVVCVKTSQSRITCRNIEVVILIIYLITWLRLARSSFVVDST